MKKYNLVLLRKSFDLEINRAKLSKKSAARYQSWIRRYLIYCKNLGIEISNESILSFLQCYEVYSTRRQGYYALKFFSQKVIKKRDFIKIEETIKLNKKRKMSKKLLKHIFYNSE